MTTLYHAFIEGGSQEAWQNARSDIQVQIKQDATSHVFWAPGEGESVHRSYLNAESQAALLTQIEALTLPEPISLKKHSIAFLSTGQGAQYPHMASTMQSMPLFAKALEKAFLALNPHLPQTLETVIYPDEGSDETLLNQTLYTQPALFAIEYAYAKTWQSFGIEPNYCMGHSIGEFASAVIAGVMTLEEGAQLICKRSSLMQSLPSKGAMAALMMGQDSQIDQWLEQAKDMGYAVTIAAFNGPKQTVLSGDSDGIEQVLTWAKEAKIRGTLITVSHAFHSSHMDPILAEFEASAAAIDFKAPTHPQLVSNRYGHLMNKTPNATYWKEHIREPVRYHQGIDALFKEGTEVFIELGPHPILIGMSKRCYTGDTPLTWLPSAKKGTDDLDTFFSSLGTLFEKGQPVTRQA